jgi:hypothetical protein
MALISLFRFTRIIMITISQNGAVDFHGFWYAGQFVRQGTDPFAAYLYQLEPKVPVKYLDGITIKTLPIAQKNLTQEESNTPLMVLFLSPLAFLSWKTAKIVWMVVNLFFLLLVPRLVIRLYPNVKPIALKYKLMIYFGLWGLLASSNAIGNGQSTFLVFILSLASILTSKKNWFLAGLVLGIALSKYSLSLPFLVFILLFHKNYKVLLVSVCFQILGFVSLAVLTRTSMTVLFIEYLRIISMYIGSPGIHLAGILSPQTLPAYCLVLIFAILATWAYLHMQHDMTHIMHTTTGSDTSHSLAGSEKILPGVVHVQALNLMNFWILLSVYHREYDAITYILFVALIIIGLTNNYWNLSRREQISLFLLTIVVTAALSRPGDSIYQVIPASFTFIGNMLASNWVASLALVIGFGINIWLSFKIRDNGPLSKVGALR